MLACALEIIDREGVEKLSMRRLARALGHDPVSLYRYATNKAALHDGIAETVLSRLSVDPTRPRLGSPAAHRRPLEAVLTLLTRAGFSGADALHSPKRAR
ncbi:TetR family transcriptional regulator [Kitasatospora sp. NPDC057223]|uniref:TetR family transcriptional regulator n=1 Tax=Kitasatospora sp. NPDC057223 TaxID=3346055 RepID=UPI00363E1A1C